MAHAERQIPQLRPPVRPLRVGFMPFTGAAPLIAAHALGYFAARGLQVELRREIGWATVRDKTIYGELDAAQAPAPMLWSTVLGLDCSPCDVLTALVINSRGTALTLSRKLWDAGVRDAVSLGEFTRAHFRHAPLTLGVAFPYSAQNLAAREWLGAAGLTAECDFRLVVLAPAQMGRHLRAGTIDGFCSDEPWNSLAVHDGAGWCLPLGSFPISHGIDSVLMVTQLFARDRPGEHAALIQSLAAAAIWCDDPANHLRLAELLSQPPYLNLPTAVISAALGGIGDDTPERTNGVAYFHPTGPRDASAPTVHRAVVLQQRLGATGLISARQSRDLTLPRQLFREDLHREFLAADTPAKNNPRPELSPVESLAL